MICLTVSDYPKNSSPLTVQFQSNYSLNFYIALRIAMKSPPRSEGNCNEKPKIVVIALFILMPMDPYIYNIEPYL